MRLRSVAAVVILGLVATLMVAAPAGARGGRPFSANLTGSTEVPGPGDPDGFGTASLRINPGHRRVCFDIRVANIALPATAAHIHQGAPGIAGPVVVTLAPPGVTGMSSGCVSTSKDIIKAIFRSPSSYYVNVHTIDFPNGAVRGPLAGGVGSGPSDPGGNDSQLLRARLSGSNEVPFPGDPDGRGEAIVAVLPDTNEVCFIIVVRGILPATAAHIHQGGPGIAGAVVVTLAPPGASGTSAGCLGGLSSSTLSAIGANPSGYYVNVHTSDFPDGAVRGQLSGQGGNGHGCDHDDDLRRRDPDGCDD